MTEQVGRYKILGPLGKGGMGVVYLAEDPLLNRRVAIKTLDLSAADSDRRDFLRASLLRDARAAAGLTHPNIVSVYDVVEEGDSAYLVLEYVAGQSLAQRLSAGPPPGRVFVMSVLREMAAALDYTHARGIVHRDIKPGNVLLDAQGTAKITDFGIARINDNRTRTSTGMMVGTIDYMAPEQVTGGAVDGRADQVSLAAVAYEMLTGRTLYGEFSFTTLAYKIVHEMPPPARSHNPSLPPGVDEVLSRALSKAPSDRFASCGEFVAALERAFQAPAAGLEAATQTMVRPVVKRRAKWPVAAGIGVVLLAGGLLVWKPWAPPREIEVSLPPKPEPAPVPQSRSPKGGAIVRKTEPAAAASKGDLPPGPPKPLAEPAQNEPVAATVAEPGDAKSEDDAPDAPQQAAPNLPPAVMAAYNQGLEAFRAKRFPEAVDAFSRSIRLKPDTGMAYSARAAIYLREGNPADALQDIAEALRINPRDPLALATRGNYFANHHEFERALADLTAALEISPTAPAYNRRGMIYAERKEYAKAISDFTAAIQKQPDFVPAYRGRRLAELAIDDRAGALADLRKLQSLGGGRKGGRK